MRIPRVTRSGKLASVRMKEAVDVDQRWDKAA